MSNIVNLSDAREAKKDQALKELEAYLNEVIGAQLAASTGSNEEEYND